MSRLSPVPPGRRVGPRHRAAVDTAPAPEAEPLVEVRDHRETVRRPWWQDIPRPSAGSIGGVAVLLVVAGGAVHLATAGTALPPADLGLDQPPSAAATESARAEEIAGGAVTPSSSEAAPAGTSPPGASAPPAPPVPVPADPGATEPAPGPLIVHVTGAVATPGIVRLSPGARVADAVDAAGGTTTEADLQQVNLARPVVDGEQVHVPRPGEEPPLTASGPAGPSSAPGAGTGHDVGTSPESGTGGGEVDGSGSSRVNVNTADAAALEELPGIGPALAQRIIDHRTTNGPFTSVDQLDEVSGIGPAILADLRDRVTV
ncbi:helix-hairpin-helix domain-containing protein [Brachybacterium sp. EF45031]|uniref:ComEA family DNA-binding protein n=1 Tax=Brachybacterium sillae TaxID=2810536 RepID=UPI00217E8646|nr:ComEA family DNA-binding protein [Brachybacterium sillae]MCS6710784.1 helix-hairpin-helix domain-containing protein [Brachybacterium sillae]